MRLTFQGVNIELFMRIREKYIRKSFMFKISKNLKYIYIYINGICSDVGIVLQ